MSSVLVFISLCSGDGVKGESQQAEKEKSRFAPLARSRRHEIYSVVEGRALAFLLVRFLNANLSWYVEDAPPKAPKPLLE